MVVHSFKIIFLILLFLLQAISFAQAESNRTLQASVIVYGGTSSAITAAVQVKKMGKSVVVVSPDTRLGGMTSSGLGWTDTGNKEVIGGLAREFYHRVWRHYQSPGVWKWQRKDDFGNRGQGAMAIDGEKRTMWIFEPEVASNIFESWVRENDLQVYRGERLDREQGVELKDGRIVSIRTLSGVRYQGDVFLDCTYEGDLMAAVGVSYSVGREGNARYGETLNGVQSRLANKNQFINRVDPFAIQGDSTSPLLPRINPLPPGADGEGDRKIQAYNFRLCLTKVKENHIPFPEPDDYQPEQYELLLRTLLLGSRHIFDHFNPVPNRKTDTDNHGSFSTDNIGMNYDYPDGTYEEREKIVREHENYQKGYYYFLCNDARVPSDVRAEMSQWGLAKDEFVETGNWPPQLYIREARRMVSDFVMTETDVTGERDTLKAIGMGSYTMDSHNVQRYVAKDEQGKAYVLNEGDFQVPIDQPYAISYDSIVPSREECSNLIVPVCLSASHVAFGSVRMEPVFMILAQSAATAASLALDRGIAVQEVDYQDLRERLLEDGQVLELSREVRVSKAVGYPRNRLGGDVVDGEQIEFVGEWTESTSLRPFVGTSYHHDGNAGKGKCTARFPFLAPKDGLHEIKVSYSVFANRAGNIRYEIKHKDGHAKVWVDQRKPHLSGDLWYSLGSFSFQRGEQYFVELFNENTSGYVVADAIQVLPF